MKKWLQAQKNKTWFIFIEELIFRYNDDRVSEIGAQLTYYLILSLFPFLIFFLNLLQFTPLADVEVLSQLLSVLPAASQKLLYDLITDIVGNSNLALLSVGALGAIWSASNGVMAIFKAVNRAYDLEEGRPFIQLRLLAIVFTMGLFLVLMLSLSVLVFGETIFNSLFKNPSSHLLLLWRFLRVLVPLVFMILILSLLYKIAPSAKKGVSIPWKSTLWGSVFTAVGIIIFSNFFSYYINNFGNYTKTYGSIGGIIILLVWLYISSILIVLGAEVNASLLAIQKALPLKCRLKS